MKSVLKTIGIISLTLIIGFTMAGCKDDDTGGGGKFMGYTLRSGSPSAASLAVHGIQEGDIQGVFTAARAVTTDDADYQGYYEHSETVSESGITITVKLLGFVWLNKTQAKYSATCSELESTFGYIMSGLEQYIPTEAMPAGTVLSSFGFNDKGIEDELNVNVWAIQYWLRQYEGVDPNTMTLMFVSTSTR